MRVAIDISQIIYGTGVSTYTKNLVRSLLALDKENEYVLFGGSLRRGKDILKDFPQAKVYPFPPTLADIIWNRLHIFPPEKLLGEIDVLHTSDWTEPPSKAFKVTTVHDLAPFLYPNLFPRDVLRNIVATHKTRLAHVRTESDRIIVPTSSTKEDLLKLGFDENKIRIIPEAADQKFKRDPKAEIEKVKRKYGIFGEYLISVGIDPRKNTDRIIKAFELSKAAKNFKLVLVGTPKYTKVVPRRNVRILGRVEEDDLSKLYSGATAMVYPSLYEGFGLPILEAFACETPVVTSNISSMAEVAGKAAFLVDPYDIHSIKDGIDTVVRGPKGFVDKGTKRVAEFSWTKTAKMTLNVYKESKK